MNERRFGYLVPVLVLCVCAACVFAFLAWNVQTNGLLIPYDKEIADALHEHERANPELKKIQKKIADTGTPEALLLVAFVASLCLLRLRQVGVAAVWVAVVLGGRYLNEEIKEFFKRERPSFPDLHIDLKPGQDPSWSFPSGHAMVSMIGYGMLAYVLLLAVPRPWLRMVLALGLVLLIGFSRLYLGAHYLTDVVGGFAAGLVWLGVWIAVIEWVRSRTARTPTPR